MKFPTLSRRFLIGLTTLFIIGMLFAYYLLVYVDLREEKLRKDKYRALARYGENMVKARMDYSKSVERARLKGKIILDSLKRKYAIYEDTIKKEYFSGLVDSLQEAKASQSIKASSNHFWKHCGPHLRKRIKEVVRADLPEMDYDGYMTLDEYYDLVHDHFDRIYFDFPPFNATTEKDRRQIFSMATSDFAYCPHQFDEFFIIKQFDESFHAHKEKKAVTANETFQTFPNHISLQSIDSFMVSEKGLVTSQFDEINLADTKYKRFVHSVKFSEEETWYLCGLIEAKNYNAQIRSVDPFIVTGAALIFLFLIVAMPVLKLLIMNIYERISIFNVWFTGLSVVIGSAVFFLLIWSFSHNLQTLDEVDNQLETLSMRIKANFQNELETIFWQVNYFNNQTNVNVIDHWKNSIQTDPSDSIVIGNVQGNLSNHFGGDSLLYPFNYVMWIDSTGHPLITLTTRDKKPDYQMPLLRNRKYFSHVLNDSLWVFSCNNSIAFSLQSISSWTDHSPEVGFGIKTFAKEPFCAPVLALSTRLYSVMETLLPTAFGFAIIDESGEVWFHSNTLKNHQENIFEEIQREGKLTAAVKGRGMAHFSSDYEGNRTRMFVQPLQHIPLHLIVFHNADYQRTPVVLTILLAFAMVSLLFVIQGVQMLILIACEYKVRKIRMERFFLKLFRPDSGHIYMYKVSLVTQLILLIIAFIFYLWSDFAAVVGFITLPVMLLAFHLALYSRQDDRRVNLFVILSGFILVLVNVFAFQWLTYTEREVTLLQQLIFVIVMLSAFRESNKKTPDHVDEIQPRPLHPFEKIRNSKKKIIAWACEYPRVYYAYLFLWLILISLFPVVHFYKMAHKQESLLWAKYQQLEEMNSAINRSKLLDRDLYFLKGHKKLMNYADLTGNYLSTSTPVYPCDNDWGEKLQELLFEVWPPFAEPFGISSAACFNGAVDGAWEWIKSSEAVEISYTLKTDLVKYSRPYGRFNPFGGQHGSIIVLLVILACLLVIRTIYFCTKYIFGIGILPLYKQPGILALKERIGLSNKIFIVGLPLSGKISDLKQSFENEPSPDWIDFQCDERTWVSDKNVCVVNHFEFGINDHPFNKKKLACLQKLLAKPDGKIIIVSTVQPSAILEVYRKRICEKPCEAEKSDDKENVPCQAQQYKIAIRKWKNLLASFEVYYKSIEPEPKAVEGNEIVYNELNSCYYIQNLMHKNNLRAGFESDEDFILNVEEISETYYHALWNSFSPEEKLLLFDLAHDSFVNLKNQRGLRLLMQKGVIVVRRDALCVMNQSFTNFILSVYREDEEVEVNKTVQAKGSWQHIQVVLVIVMIAIVVFIAMAQKELFNNLNALILTVTGALTMLSKFGGLFGGGTKTKD